MADAALAAAQKKGLADVVKALESRAAAAK